MPILNWWKLHETSDFKWLLKDDNKKVNRYAEKVAKRVRNEFINVFGLDERYKQYLKKVCKLELYYIDMAITGDRSKKIFADVLELELKDLLTEEEKNVVYNHGVMHIERFMGFKLDVKTTTVYEFYSYVKEIEKQAQYIKQQDGEQSRI